MSFTLLVSQFEMSTLNEVAALKRKVISVALDTSNFERSPSNNGANKNIFCQLKAGFASKANSDGDIQMNNTRYAVLNARGRKPV